METLAYTVNGQTTEVSLTTLGSGAHLKINFVTLAASKCTINLAALPPELAAPIPFEAPCVLWTGRTAVGSGGTILFQGRRTDNSGTATAQGASQQIVIEDAWYDLRFTTLQAAWQNIVSYNPTPVYGPVFMWPDCVLFESSPNGFLLPNGTWGTYAPAPALLHITTGQAIREILAFAIAFAGVNLQIGQIDPAAYVPFYPVRSMRCADAIKICLRVHPDCTTEIDYSTTPPTFHVRARSSLTPLTLPYKSSSSSSSSSSLKHISSKPRPRPELIPSRVAIFIKETSNLNGHDILSWGEDIYPPGSRLALRSCDTSLDMTGPKIANTVATLTTASFDPTDLQWWMTKVPSLQGPPGSSQYPNGQTQSLVLLNSTINTGAAQGITVEDASHNPIDISAGNYAYELVSGTPADWMEIPTGGQLQWIDATVKASFSYKKTNSIPGSGAIDTAGEHPHSVRVKLINIPTSTFSLRQILNTGESYPGGLAQAIYTALSQLQYNFDHTILERPFATIIKPGKHALNLSGGSPAWTAMNAMIQSAELDLVSSSSSSSSSTTATHTLQCGPVAHLEAGELVQLFNLFANRDLSRINPNERLAGTSQSGGDVTLGSDQPKENTVPAEPVWAENSNVVTANGAVTGQTIQSAPLVAAITSGKTPANGGSAVGMITMQPREFTICDNAGNVYFAAVQATQGHTPA